MDLVSHLDMQDSDLLNTSMRQAGTLLIYICKETKNLVTLWYVTGCNYHMINDNPSIKQNIEGFKEHRHDIYFKKII